MKQWKVLINRISEDYGILRKDARYFMVIFVLIQLAGIGNLRQLSPSDQWQTSDSLAILATIGITILSLLNLFYFQRQYTQHLNTPVPTHSFTEVLWNYLRVYVLQFLLYFLIAGGIALVLGLPLILMSEGTLLYSAWIVVLVASLVSVSFFWFLRLMFVSYILLYKRTNYGMKGIVRESIYLIQSRLPIFVGILILSLVGSGPMLLNYPFYSHSLSSPWIFQIISILIGLFASYICCALTVYAMKDEHESFMVLSDA